MKYIIIAVILSSCFGKEKSGSYKSKPADTTSVVKTFVDMPTGSLKFDIVYRVTKDTITFIDADSLTKVKRHYRDTLYYVPVKDSIKVTYYQALPGTVYEGDRIDSAAAILGRWINLHSEFFPKKDTLKKK